MERLRSAAAPRPNTGLGAHECLLSWRMAIWSSEGFSISADTLHLDLIKAQVSSLIGSRELRQLAPAAVASGIARWVALARRRRPMGAATIMDRCSRVPQCLRT